MSDAANTQPEPTASQPLTTQDVQRDQAETPAAVETPTTKTQNNVNALTGKTSSELFSLALSAQQKNNFDEALSAYNQLLKSTDLTKDQASVAHHNLSLIYLNKNDFAKAQIENYLALAKNPSNSAARTLNNSNEHFKNSILQADRSWSSSASLQFIPLELFFVAALGCVFFMGKSLVDYFRSRAIAVQDNLEIPSYPLLFKIGLVPFVVFLVLLSIRFYDENTIKAIVIKENTEVSSSAGANQALVTTVNPGLEVIVLRQQTTDNAQYAQIRSTGQFSGWVKLENLVLINPH